MSAPIPRTVRMRLCSANGCTVRFDPDTRDVPYPRRYCSAMCFYADTAKPVVDPKPRAQLRRTTTPAKRQPISPASPEQREAVRGRSCIVDASHEGKVQPAHLIPRGMLTEGQEDARATVPLCPACHRAYDDGHLSILEHLEPYGRETLAYAVARFGLISTLERVTNERWRPA